MQRGFKIFFCPNAFCRRRCAFIIRAARKGRERRAPMQPIVSDARARSLAHMPGIRVASPRRPSGAIPLPLPRSRNPIFMGFMAGSRARALLEHLRTMTRCISTHCCVTRGAIRVMHRNATLSRNFFALSFAKDVDFACVRAQGAGSHCAKWSRDLVPAFRTTYVIRACVCVCTLYGDRRGFRERYFRFMSENYARATIYIYIYILRGREKLSLSYLPTDG